MGFSPWGRYLEDPQGYLRRGRGLLDEVDLNQNACVVLQPSWCISVLPSFSLKWQKWSRSRLWRLPGQFKFEAIDEGAVFDEEQYSAFKQGDAILVRLDGEEPEVRHFKGYGWRTPNLVEGIKFSRVADYGLKDPLLFRASLID